MYDGTAYTATTDKMLIVRLNEEICALVHLPRNVDQLKVSHDGTTLHFTAENIDLSNIPLNSDNVTLWLNGAQLPSLITDQTETYAIGRSDLNANVVILDVKTT